MESDMGQVGDLENGNHFLTLQGLSLSVMTVLWRARLSYEKPFRLSSNGPDGFFDGGRQLLKTETTRLNALIASAERDLESDGTIPEEARGKLRVAVGKAKMLLRKKFIQFKDLCFKNLGVESDVRYPVTSEDLAGYWDTIVIQILQVYKIFDEVEEQRKNNWEEPNIIPINQNREKKISAKLNGDNKSLISEAL